MHRFSGRRPAARQTRRMRWRISSAVGAEVRSEYPFSFLRLFGPEATSVYRRPSISTVSADQNGPSPLPENFPLPSRSR